MSKTVDIPQPEQGMTDEDALKAIAAFCDLLPHTRERLRKIAANVAARDAALAEAEALVKDWREDRGYAPQDVALLFVCSNQLEQALAKAQEAQE